RVPGARDAQVERLHRAVRLGAGVPAAGGEAGDRQAASAPDAVRQRLPVHLAGSVVRGVRGTGADRGRTAGDPARQRGTAAGAGGVAVAAGYVLQPGEGAAGQEDPAVKASRVSTDGSMTVIESDSAGGAPRHVHAREDECFYVLKGAITVECGDDSWELEQGAFVFLPRGVPHAWDVIGDRATVMIMTAPGGLDEFLAELHDHDRSAWPEV